MSSKGKQISVIIAGATGSTGREIVSRLVSHPDVSRVVALARYPIPVNRWTAVFPHLHVGDARRYLSVVPVDWEKVLADASRIPRSYVSDGVWRFDDAAAEWRRYEWHCRRTYRLSRASGDADAAFRTNAGGAAAAASSDASAASTSASWASGSPQGYIKMPAGWSTLDADSAGRRGGASGPRDVLEELRDKTPSSRRSSAAYDEKPSAAGTAGGASDAERRRWSQEFLRQLVQNSFYRSVFSGHQVAINCLGTSHVLSSAELTLVDYDLSIAFAKMVRLFNCMAHAEPTEDEERLLVEATSRELDSVLWNEIYAACYGKTVARETRAALLEERARHAEAHEQKRRQHKDSEPAADVAHRSKKERESMHWMNRGQEATLRHFSQVSVRAANEHSPLAYLRTQGKRDNAILRLFNRGDDNSAFSAARGKARGKLQSKTSVTFGAPSLVGLSAATLRPSRLRVPHWLHRALFGSVPGTRRGGAALAGQESARGPAHDDDGNHGASTRAADAEVIARQRAQMLLRRDVVKIWEHANLTIWRPGVFGKSRKRRWAERVIAMFERPVDVKCLAECIVDDIVESFYRSSPADGEDGGGDKQRMPRVGRTKVINGSSVVRRTYMKALEDGLDERDTRRARRLRK
ncbi:hypothetical protein NESM_000047600 [Novymonas esmeraldas]|uniref:NAD(P)-binding domain-containing protein n=1 Tax=Novymonas esmeraldas TaxID=1808958 RepID=A0AAW0F2Y3_9TRYP